MKLELDKWIFQNEVPFAVELGDELNQVLKKFEEVILHGEDDNGYYYLSNGYRFGFQQNFIDEIGVNFSFADSTITLQSGDGINLSKSVIHEVLNYLNDNLVAWEAIPTRDTNYLYIKLIKSQIVLIFDIYTGLLDKMVKSDLPAPANNTG